MTVSSWLIVGLCFVGASAVPRDARSQSAPKEPAQGTPEEQPAQSAPEAPESPEVAPDAETESASPAEEAESASPAEETESAPAAATQAPPAAPATPAEGGTDEVAAPHREQPQDDDYEDAQVPPSVAEEPKFKRFQFGIMLDLTVPFGKTADFVSSVSIQGFSLDGRYFITKNVGVGLGVGFNTLSQKSEGTFTWDNITATGIHTKEVSFTPLLGKVIYAFRGQPKLTPYVAMGLGAVRTSSRVFVGISGMSRGAWQFSATPEVGATLTVSKAKLLANVRINYLTETNQDPSHLFGNLSLGVAIQ